MAIVDALETAVVRCTRYLGRLVGLLYYSLKVVWTERGLGSRELRRQTVDQVYFTGVQAVPTVVALAIVVGSTGMVRAVTAVLGVSGAEGLGRLAMVVILREVAPLLTGVIVVARSVTATTAEIGTMRVQREIEALEVMGISPLLVLVTPRIAGGLVALASLEVIFSAVAVVSAAVVGLAFFGIPPEIFQDALFGAIGPGDLVLLAGKTLVGGVGIFVLAAYHGLAVEDSSAEVPAAVSRSALHAVVFLVLTHLAVALLALAPSFASGPIG